MMSNPPLHTEPKPIPAELDRWNWGAFLLNWIWGVGNNTFIALLTLVPFFGILIMPFVLGAKGSKWAWRNGRWDSIAHFKRVQRLWAIWGAVIWVALILWFAVLFGGVFYSLKNSEAYALGAARLRASAEAADVLGTPIATGFPWGSVSIGGGSGSATLTFSATGPKAAGQVFVDAVRHDGVWSIRNPAPSSKSSRMRRVAVSGRAAACVSADSRDGSGGVRIGAPSTRNAKSGSSAPSAN